MQSYTFIVRSVTAPKSLNFAIKHFLAGKWLTFNSEITSGDVWTLKQQANNMDVKRFTKLPEISVENLTYNHHVMSFYMSFYYILLIKLIKETLFV